MPVILLGNLCACGKPCQKKFCGAECRNKQRAERWRERYWQKKLKAFEASHPTQRAVVRDERGELVDAREFALKLLGKN